MAAYGSGKILFVIAYAVFRRMCKRIPWMKGEKFKAVNISATKLANSTGHKPAAARAK